MATVYVVTAGSGEGYRIERVYLDSEQVYGFAQAYNGISPVEPVQVEEWLDVDPALSLNDVHRVAHDAEHALAHAIPKLSTVVVHSYPAHGRTLSS